MSKPVTMTDVHYLVLRDETPAEASARGVAEFRKEITRVKKPDGEYAFSWRTLPLATVSRASRTKWSVNPGLPRAEFIDAEFKGTLDSVETMLCSRLALALYQHNEVSEIRRQKDREHRRQRAQAEVESFVLNVEPPVAGDPESDYWMEIKLAYSAESNAFGFRLPIDRADEIAQILLDTAAERIASREED